MTAPAGARLCEVVESRASGAYRVVSLLDREGPEPSAGQLYALGAGVDRDGAGGPGPQPSLLPVATTIAAARGGRRLDFLVDAAGRERLAAELAAAPERGGELAAVSDRPDEPPALGSGPPAEPLDVGRRISVAGPVGAAFREPRQVKAGAAGAVLVGGGIGIAPLALLRRRFAERGVPHRVLLGFRDAAHTGGLDLFCGSSGALCPEVRLATEDAHAGVRGRAIDLLTTILAGDDAASGVVYAGGPPAMLTAVGELCAERRVAFESAPSELDGAALLDLDQRSS